MGIAHLDNLLALPRGAELALYGCGAFGQHLLSLLGRFRPDVRVVAFASTHPSPPVAGLEVLGPDELARRALGPGGPTVVIAAHQVEAICLELARRGLGDMLVASQLFYQRLNPECGPEEYRERLAEAARVFSRPVDREFLGHVPALFLPGPDVSGARRFFARRFAQAGEQYFDHIAPAPVRTVVDGGAYDGQSVLRFSLRFGDPRIYAFEPTPAWELGPHADLLRENPRVSMHSLGLYDGSRDLAMDHIGLGAAVVDSAGADALRIRAVALDDFCAGHGVERIDFLKLDIEGCELKALQGGAGILAASRPQLAICLYHQPRDYHEIPLYLASLLQDYEFAMGCHTPLGFTETVLYAVPRELARQAGL